MGRPAGFVPRMSSTSIRAVWVALLWAGVLSLLAGCASTGPKVRNTARTFDTVVIDAGHGGFDSGAIGRNGIKEKQVALDVAHRLDARLRAAGFRTVLTRASDTFVPLESRALRSNRERNAIFVSIHFNHTRARRVSGAETYYAHPYARGLAERIQFHMTRSRPAVDRGVKRANFVVLRRNLNPAVLVECGFLSNGHEARLASSATHRELIAECLAHALIEHRQPSLRGREPAAPYPQR